MGDGAVGDGLQRGRTEDEFEVQLLADGLAQCGQEPGLPNAGGTLEDHGWRSIRSQQRLQTFQLDSATDQIGRCRHGRLLTRAPARGASVRVAA